MLTGMGLLKHPGDPEGRIDVITARQIREARELLGWYPLALARKSGIQFATLNRAELNGGRVTMVQAEKLQRTLESAGVEFIVENGGSGVRLRKGSN